MLAAALVLLQIGALALLGQPSFCTCGYIKLWESVVASAGTSQHIADWYTFSHIIHGFIFYLALWYFFPRLSVWQRFVIAIGIEVVWEISENTPWVIDAYRQQALAAGYTGDSILNSVFDTLAAGAGFLLARRLPVAVIIGLTLLMEIGVGYAIRDNLTLNILNFAVTSESIEAWQMGL